MMEVTYHVTGPVLQGHGPAIVDRHVHEMADTVANESLRRVRDRLGHVLRHPTGYYESRVIKSTRSDGAEVTDSNVVYGPWLEGVSSRNSRSRFKGYRTFQLVGQQIQNELPMLIHSQQDKMIRELNGGN